MKRYAEEAASASEDLNKEDVVKDFLEQGGTGKEFLALLEADNKRKAPELAAIYSALEATFVR